MLQQAKRKQKVQPKHQIIKYSPLYRTYLAISFYKLCELKTFHIEISSFRLKKIIWAINTCNINFLLLYAYYMSNLFLYSLQSFDTVVRSLPWLYSKFLHLSPANIFVKYRSVCCSFTFVNIVHIYSSV